jgi:catalase
MATRTPKTAKTPTRRSTPAAAGDRRKRASAAKSAARSTVSGPTRPGGGSSRPGGGDALERKLAATQALAASFPYNENKVLEYGEASRQPPAGKTAEASDDAATASTATEANASAKTGNAPAAGTHPGQGPLERVRTDASGRELTTNQGVPVADNQSSLKAGLRGPTLLEDFILREKITHFDHERIPERVVHARGSGAHGYFECYEPLTRYTRASLFAAAGKRTPVFVRFSTVAGERGSADTVRDVRGFAVKFYTDEGNWDLVGNNIPVFFIQDAIKFPDLVHAVKPEPHHGMPQASSAHDTLWDFVSLMPESTHMLMWVMSDRGIPRSYRMMQGFGVHTFRLVNAQGESQFVKFHWSPKAGTHSLDWDEAVKIAGADADFHRRDLWEAIEAGHYPEYELGLQIFTEAQAEKLSFDVLDPTKLVPEELAPLLPVGRMVLDRNPDNFFAETEQVAFCTAHVVPGIDFSNDPLLAGRIHSYVDTQLTRLGGANFHEIPINAPLAEVHNNQRDGFHRQAINRGRVAYEPNSLGGGCPFQAGARGFASFPQRTEGDKVRGKPEKFAEHYNQARLFWLSQTPVEQAHIVRAFRFELTRVQTPAIRERMVASLANVDDELARRVADGLGIPVPAALPRAVASPPQPEVERSPALSLTARPGDGSIAGRRIAILVEKGIDAAGATAVHEALASAGAVPRFVGARLGAVAGAGRETIEVDVTLEAAPSVLFDALVVPDGDTAIETLRGVGPAVEFVKDQYRHCKPIMVLGAGGALLAKAGVPATLRGGAPDPGIVSAKTKGAAPPIEAFMAAMAKHRHFERELEPPPV